tara:strand:+ start:258 stop:785 length:528 start_codon:yes stop_codon:yes gene_type:complete
MKFLIFKFFLVIIYLLSTVISFSNNLDIKNLVIYEKVKKLENINFKDINNKTVYLNDFKGKLVIINFWATWCAPCREEMPSLDKLQRLENIQNLKILPINVGQEKVEKSENFFKDLNIKNLNLYFDNSIELAKAFALRGLPTSIIINKKGEEIGRIVGSIDFMDKKFIDWLTQVD